MAVVACFTTDPARGADPVVLTSEHVDIRIRYRPEAVPALDIVATNEDARPPVDHASTNCVLQVAESSRLELPADLPPLGTAGDPIWVLPASQKEGILYLGMSGEGNPFGLFEAALEMRLLAVDGPGHFFLWQAELGGLQFWMNSRDGLGTDDVFRQAVGGHSHFDWGFSTSGVYRLTFQAVARRLGETTNLVSDPAVFTFHVHPLPAVTLSPFQQWQARQWPGEKNPAILSPTSDPDGDGLVNLWEYALGSSPITPGPSPFDGPSVSLTGTGAATRAAVRIPRAAEATDLEYRVWSAENVRGPWVLRDLVSKISPGSGQGVVVTFRDPEAVAPRTAFFYRVDAQLKNQP